MNAFYQASLEESLKRILETPLGSRVMLPEFGSKLYLLTDRRMDDNFKLDFYRYVAEAIENGKTGQARTCRFGRSQRFQSALYALF